MKIASSNVVLASQHASVEKHTRRETLRAWTGNQRPDFEGNRAPQQVPHRDPVSLSQQGKAAQQAAATEDVQDQTNGDARLQMLITLVEALTGRKIRILSMKDLAPTDAPPQNVQDPNQASSQTPAQASAGFGVEYDRHETHYEAEQTAFSAQGVVRTSDGKEIAFTLQLSMSRAYAEQTDVSVRLGDAARKTQDPLVINFGGTAAQLTSTKFAFDLNADGTAEDISFVSPNSGFVALDKNQDGKINDGSELFGPATGNGFNELAALDQDGNHWIDENDAAFELLKIWTKDAEGNDQLVSLKAAGVGALYLGNVSTEFSLKNANNQLDGQVRSTGVYLNEDGSVGSLQQIDLAV